MSFFLPSCLIETLALGLKVSPEAIEGLSGKVWNALPQPLAKHREEGCCWSGWPPSAQPLLLRTCCRATENRPRGVGGSVVGDEKIPWIKVPSMKTLQGYGSPCELTPTFYPKEAHFGGMRSVVAVSASVCGDLLDRLCLAMLNSIWEAGSSGLQTPSPTCLSGTQRTPSALHCCGKIRPGQYTGGIQLQSKHERQGLHRMK